MKFHFASKESWSDFQTHKALLVLGIYGNEVDGPYLQ